jgi:hypothetical protein
MAKKISENLSSNTLFHFTPSLVNLLGILSHNFKPRYCLENTEYFGNTQFNDLEMAYPMVCFCDIPLSKIKKHLGDYGDYGIGLTKEWGFRKNLSPIMYTTPDARTSLNLVNLINWYIENIENKETASAKELNDLISDYLMFTKSYDGSIIRDGRNEKKRFYDEREWRWIPKIDHPEVCIHLDKDSFSDENFRTNANSLLSEHFSLKFEPNDIKYLILKKENEIDTFIQSIEQIKGRFDQSIIKRLLSRIITREQILYDL